MKFFFLALSAAFSAHSTLAQSVTIEVQGPCEADLWVEAEVESTMGQSVGSVTIEHLDTANIPYLGDEKGLAQIKQSPLGDKAMIIISETEMKSFGWCYEVDGETPGSYPHEIEIKTGEEKIRWYYAYAHLKDGEWIGACVPSYLESPKQFCVEN